MLLADDLRKLRLGYDIKKLIPNVILSSWVSHERMRQRNQVFTSTRNELLLELEELSLLMLLATDGRLLICPGVFPPVSTSDSSDSTKTPSLKMKSDSEF